MVQERKEMTFCRAHGAAQCRTCQPVTIIGALTPQKNDQNKPIGRHMNKTETHYANTVLEPLRLAGEIVSYAYEPITLILGTDPKTGRLCTYRCDFAVAPKSFAVADLEQLRGVVLHPILINKPLPSPQQLAHELGLHTWDQGDDGFGGEYIPDNKAVHKIIAFIGGRTDLAGLELHEVKGPHEWEDARVKRIAAAKLFPHFVFKLCRWQKGQWDIKEIR